MSHPDQALSIKAGLGEAPFRAARALGTFADWREAVLAAIARQPALAQWRARDPQDFGLMLVEMAAYFADVVSFYDALVANEGYLGTAMLPGSRRKLVELLGYRPRPAVASQVLLAALADGANLVTLPEGTAFRTAQFLDAALVKQPPQVFELDGPATLDPRINTLAVHPVRESLIDKPVATLLVEHASLRVKEGDPLLLLLLPDQPGSPRDPEVVTVTDIGAPVSLPNGVRAVTISFSEATLPYGARYDKLKVLGAGATTRLWTGGTKKGEKQPIDGSDLLLESQVPLRVADYLLLQEGGTFGCYTVTAVHLDQRILLPSHRGTILDEAKKEHIIDSPEIYTVITKVTVDKKVDWPPDAAGRITLYHSFFEAAKVIEPFSNEIRPDTTVSVTGGSAPRVAVKRVLVEDANKDGAEMAFDSVTGSASFDTTKTVPDSLTAPLTVFGNVISASRGETVRGELLGVGDASLGGQTFKLKKKPLTYRSADNADGIASTLSIRVGGVLWREVPSFYGQALLDQVYTVRHYDDGETYVTIGAAARVPTGAKVTADYRYGAGAARPPAGAVNQLAKPVAGLRAVRNVLAAFGGADAESAAEMAASGPQSALLLGRAISLVDLQTAAAAVPGVKSVRTSWCWDPWGLSPAAIVHYIGDRQLIPAIRTRLRQISEPGLSIDVEQAQSQQARLELQLVTDNRYDPADVVARAMAPLYAPRTTPGSGGLLRPENLGPGGVIYLSRIAAAVMEVAGVLGIKTARFDGALCEQSSYAPQPGCYWDFGDPQRGDLRIAIHGVN